MSNDEREYVYCLIMRLSSVSTSNDERDCCRSILKLFNYFIEMNT